MINFSKVLYGGSFDPPHKGHLELVNYVFSRISIDNFIILPCYIQPLKDKNIAEPIHRLNMLKLLFRNLDVEISKYEISKQDLSYTVDSINFFKPDLIIVGMDSFKTIKEWKNYEEILSKVSLLVISRNDEKIEDVLYNIFDLYKMNFLSDNFFSINIENYKPIYYLNGFKNDISSTEIRDKLYKREKVEGLSLEVEQYIENNKLYLKNV